MPVAEEGITERSDVIPFFLASLRAAGEGSLSNFSCEKIPGERDL